MSSWWVLLILWFLAINSSTTAGMGLPISWCPVLLTNQTASSLIGSHQLCCLHSTVLGYPGIRQKCTKMFSSLFGKFLLQIHSLTLQSFQNYALMSFSTWTAVHSKKRSLAALTTPASRSVKHAELKMSAAASLGAQPGDLAPWVLNVSQADLLTGTSLSARRTTSKTWHK